MTFLTHLECSACGQRHAADRIQNVCTQCQKPLLARYDLEALAAALRKEDLRLRPRTMWRYGEFLPVVDSRQIVSLGEGYSPLIKLQRMGAQLGLEELWLKDESRMPTGSFKDRGLAVAVSKAKEFGITRAVIPSAGNAAGSLAAYGARAKLEVHVFLPEGTPESNVTLCRLSGAKLQFVQGSIREAGQAAAALRKEQPDLFDMSTFKEPYRVEGKKTMGLEIAEQCDWQLPDVIIYPAGGGTGLVGMWKAFQELAAVDLIPRRFPRMVAVQAEGCAPVVKALQQGKEDIEPWASPDTIASGLNVPSPLAGFLMLQVLRESQGAAVAVSDGEMLEAMRLLSRSEGLLACPEGAATVAAVAKLVNQRVIEKKERIVLFQTGSALKYPEVLARL